MSCRLCDGTCANADLSGLTAPELVWLWDGLAVAADRRGDPTMGSGTTTVTAPDDVAARAAAAGLLGRRHLTAGQRVRVDLAALAASVAPLTPGAVAAHVTGRRLAQRHAARAARADNEATLRSRLEAGLPEVVDDQAWAAFKRSGWVTRALAASPEALDAALAVIATLPGDGDPPVDRRVLAQVAAQNPHALDRGEIVGGLALALLTATGRVPAGANPREAWASVGIAYDDITGGLTVLGITPAGWDIPDGAPVTVPPRVLADRSWPEGTGPVFVTENPSVLSAAVDITGAPIICTSGTPSAVEVAALARLAEAGWQLHVRADFDDAGINHVSAILDAAHGAEPWRMTAEDYRTGLAAGAATVPLRLERLTATPWDPPLADVMRDEGFAVFEEALLDELVEDLRDGARSRRC